ncbi:hypothetical protein BT96DRAFT_421837 [Gymnopus androsaceus JB14]|uniref:Uncharacterized protein n=1 Tax=Gymnopus androsaceus JB14 TaxID=1447944 RepID=A0A6A4GUK6_9AGAR|nr:hypothetical protein BT96DRAFT_421837 [Gymnopus androsaceus JB14]
MHSPIEPGSPTFSTPSSGSDVEEINIFSGPSNSTAPLLSSSGQTQQLQSPSSKRRLNSGHGLGTSSHRDDLLDSYIVDTLRKEIGDPFYEN